MIVALLLACAGDAPEPGGGDDTAAPPAPAAGDYDVVVAETWEGDCAFEDLATGEEPEQVWTLDPRGDALVVFPDFWSVVWCALDGMGFTCDTGSYAYESGAGDYTLTDTLSGTFDTPEHFSGVYTFGLDCSGTVCRDVRELYGEDLDFPCTLQAAVEGHRR